MDKKTYYDTSVQMEKQGVDPGYILGWQTGFLHIPKLEEQRVTDAYEAGFNHGMEGVTDGFTSWAKQ